MNDMQTSLDRHKNLKLPKFPEDEEFSDWVSELYETDGYYVGIAMSLINGEKNLAIDKSHIDKLEQDIKKFSSLEEDKFIYQDCIKYLESLKNIVSLL